MDGDALFEHYRHRLEELGKQPGTLALIFGKAQNKFQDPARLRRVVGVPPAQRLTPPEADPMVTRKALYVGEADPIRA